MKITYISHSGFAVELPSATLLFDYYKGELPVFATDKPLYVFASHSHGDHFVPQIFDLAGQHPQVHFVLSHDIWMMRKKHTRAGVPETMFESATYMRAHETRHFPLTNAVNSSPEISLPPGDQPSLKVTTLRSTDMGVAFLVECDGLQIYHAGDLHWWLWPGDTKQAAGNMTANYQREIGHLAELLSASHLDLAFLPLDPRLEENYALGLDHFLQNISVQHVFPMHMWDDYEVINRYIEHRNQTSPCVFNTSSPFPSNIYSIIQEGQHWNLL